LIRYDKPEKERIVVQQQILVLKNELVDCRAVQDYMQRENVGVHCAESVADAVESVFEREYCLAIVAVRPSESTDIEMLRMIRHAQKMPIIVLTDQLAPCDRITLLQAGATVCTERPIDPVVCTVQASSLIRLYLDAKEEKQICQPMIFGTELVIDTTYRQVLIDGNALNLTRKEFELLVCLAKHPCQVWSRVQLYRYVWNDTLGLNGDNTVKTHIGNLKKKLASFGKNYIQNSRGVGYKFVPPDCGERSQKTDF